MIKPLDNGKVAILAVSTIVLAVVITYVYALIYSSRKKKEYVSSIPINEKIGMYNLDTMTDFEFASLQMQFNKKITESIKIIDNLESQFEEDSIATADLIAPMRMGMVVKTKEINTGLCLNTHSYIPYEEVAPAETIGQVSSFIDGEIKVPYELASARLSSMPILTSVATL